MEQFRNWRWYRGLGGGPIVDLGSHQIDIYNWFLGARPRASWRAAALDYYDPKTHEWYDTVMAIYEYATPAGPGARVLPDPDHNGSQGYYETFMGDQGSLEISESEATTGLLYRDQRPRLGLVGEEGLGHGAEAQEPKPQDGGAVLDVRESVRPPSNACRSSCATRTTSPTSRTSSTPFADGEAQLPGRSRLRDGGHGAEGQRGDRREAAAVVPAGGLQGMTRGTQAGSPACRWPRSWPCGS